MKQQLNLVFKQFDEQDPPAGTAISILNQIERERNRLLRAELFLFRLGFFGSLFILSYTVWVFGQTIINSEFWRIASLISSDLGAVAANWQEFCYSLLETLPVSGIIAILLPLFTLFLFFNFYLALNNKNHAFHQKVKTV